MKKRNALALSLALLSGSAMAKDNLFQQCGIGAAVFPDNGTAAALSNVIWDLGITATTSYITTKDACSGIDAQTARFINDTYKNIEEETAQGEGEHLTAMLNIMQCDNNAHADIVGGIRAKFEQQVSEADYDAQTSVEKAQGYYNLVQETVNAQFSQQCAVI